MMYLVVVTNTLDIMFAGVQVGHDCHGHAVMSHALCGVLFEENVAVDFWHALLT